MKVWNNLVKYRSILYLSSNKCIVPIVIYLIFTYITYKEKSLSFIQTASISAVMTGYIMLWISFTFFENEDAVIERVLYCNVQQNKVKYYGSKILTLFMIGAVISFIGASYPFFVNFMNQFGLFDRTISFVDFLCSLILHMILSCVFISVSYLFQPRNLANRKFGVLLMLMIVITSLSENGIISEFEMMKYLIWLLPPVSRIINCFNSLDYFTVNSMLFSFLYGAIYSGIIMTFGVFVVDKRDF